MWMFTRYGFYSIACAENASGSTDPQTIMIRARCLAHVENLKERFTSLANFEVVTTPKRDYRYRMIAPKAIWTQVLAELASEQEWSNFKNEAADFQGKTGSEYIQALHDVWGIMYSLQNRKHRPPS
jgi:hypothetical protein